MWEGVLGVGLAEAEAGASRVDDVERVRGEMGDVRRISACAFRDDVGRLGAWACAASTLLVAVNVDMLRAF